VHLFGVRSILVYQAIFLGFAWAGALFEASAVVNFGDMMILGMAFPNLLGVFLLSGRLKADLDVYRRKLRAGEFPRYDRRTRRAEERVTAS
jgi:AGCS family alanine or glycine:cation symporter